MKLFNPRPDSLESGLCLTCKHFTNGMCSMRKICGQKVACRSQYRALLFGRQKSGRVRNRQLMRSNFVKEEFRPAWECTYELMKNFGDRSGCIWINMLTNVQQVSVRRLIRKGELCVVHLEGVLSRGEPAIFLDKEELRSRFKKWVV